MLAQLERGAGLGRGKTFNDLLNVSAYKEVLDDNELNYMTAHRWQSLADMPEAEFERKPTRINCGEIGEYTGW
jgi:hypothetical protein